MSESKPESEKAGDEVSGEADSEPVHQAGGKSGGKVLYRGLVFLAGFVLAALTVAGFLGELNWRLDLASHFRVQYMLTLAAVAFAAGLLKMRRAAAYFAAFAAVNLATIIPLYVGGGPAGQHGPNTLRTLVVNVHTASRSFGRVANLIAQTNPDLVLLIEVNATWLAELPKLSQTHPYSVVKPRNDNFGIAFFSRLPLRTGTVVQIGEAGVPSILAEVKTRGALLTVIGTHPLPPIGAKYSRLRNEQLSVAAQVAAKSREPVLLLGDLNCTPFSPYFRRLVAESGLHDSSAGFGVQPTWPVGPAWSVLLRVPIDHCLHSQDVQVVARRIGPAIGSDHLPLIVDFNLGAQ